MDDIRLISIHAPHEGERLNAGTASTAGSAFQSTLPTRGSDSPCSPAYASRRYFNPRSPRGGATQQHPVLFHQVQNISIHAPHEGERRAR